MTQKFGRNYRLTIDPADGKQPILITKPFTVEFFMQRNTNISLNRLTLDIYNLSEDNRARIFQDRFDLDVIRKLTFEAGYDTLYRIFDGRIYEASSAREGTNIITRIESRDALYDVATTQTFQTLQSGQTLGDVLKFLTAQFTNVKLGAIGAAYSQQLQRPVMLNGNTFELLKTYSSGQLFIDSGKIYFLSDSEVLAGKVHILNDATGLLETPRREDGLLSVTTLLETGINVAEMVKLESTIQKVYNGQYKVIGIQHQGIISEAVGGRCVSTFSLLAPQKFKNFTEVKPQ